MKDANWKPRLLRNPETGEVMEWDEHVEPKPKRPGEKRQQNRRFQMSYLDRAIELANMPLTGNDRRVLTALTTFMEQDKPFRYSTTDIAAKLGMTNTNVSRCIRNLRDAGLIIQIEPMKVYLDPDFYWRGGEPERQAAVELVKKIRAADAATETDGGAA